jgi:prevent-host-death family protein
MPKTTTINVADAKRHFADPLGPVAYSGETITITRRGKPMARPVPVDVDTVAPHVADAQGWLEDDDPSWIIVTCDTAGEVLRALVRCLGVEKVSCLDVEVHQASPHAD